jgi:hypothetical protein
MLALLPRLLVVLTCLPSIHYRESLRNEELEALIKKQKPTCSCKGRRERKKKREKRKPSASNSERLEEEGKRKKREK